MARIRTIKPEFWDSPSTAAAGPWARLAYIAMWNWADDYGRGTANLKELEGFIFPSDDVFTDRSGNTVHFRSVVAEVSESFGVVFYSVNGRPYYEIPAWDRHQRNERRSKASKYPGPDTKGAVTTPYAEMYGISATKERKITEAPNISGTGTGEQGNRGTEVSPIEHPPLTAEGRGQATGPVDHAALIPAQPQTGETKSAAKNGSRLPDGWSPPRTEGNKKAETGFSAEQLRTELDKFRDYWAAKTGRDATKLDWSATWRNWLRNAKQWRTGSGGWNPRDPDWQQLADRAAAMDAADALAQTG